MKVGFIGLGVMGEPMARHILDAGFELLAVDANKESAEALIAKGAGYTASAGDAASQCEAVILCVPSPGPQEIVMADVLANAKPPRFARKRKNLIRNARVARRAKITANRLSGRLRQRRRSAKSTKRLCQSVAQLASPVA